MTRYLFSYRVDRSNNERSRLQSSWLCDLESLVSCLASSDVHDFPFLLVVEVRLSSRQVGTKLESACIWCVDLDHAHLACLASPDSRGQNGSSEVASPFAWRVTLGRSRRELLIDPNLHVNLEARLDLVEQLEELVIDLVGSHARHEVRGDLCCLPAHDST